MQITSTCDLILPAKFIAGKSEVLVLNTSRGLKTYLESYYHLKEVSLILYCN